MNKKTKKEIAKEAEKDILCYEVSIVCNGIETVYYQKILSPAPEPIYQDLKSMLQCLFNNHAEFYALFGIIKEDAILADWHPDHNDFITCEGFQKAVNEQFKIDKVIEIIALNKEQLVERLAFLKKEKE